MTFVGSGVAVVTGAGSGIGRGLALRLAEMGSAVALVDVDEAALMETAALLCGKRATLHANADQGGARATAPVVRGRRAEITTHVVDVADERAMQQFADDVVAQHGRVTLLINNAGVSLFGDFEEIAVDDFRWLMGVNFWGTLYGVKYFLPILRKQPRGHIANLSSVFGLVAPPGQCAYATSKFAVRGFSEALRHELAGGNVSLSVVHPAGVKTAIARRGRLAAGVPESRKTEGVATLDRLATITPEQAAERILRGVERREPRILIGAGARIIDVMQRVRPATYWKPLEKRYNRKS